MTDTLLEADLPNGAPGSTPVAVGRDDRERTMLDRPGIDALLARADRCS